MRKQGGKLVAEGAGYYRVTSRRVREDHILEVAGDIMERRVVRGEVMNNPTVMSEFLRARLGYEEREVFAVVFLDNRHRVLAFDRMFFGTIDGASVHPREVVKRALTVNAAATCFAHNHPSGVAEPSQADRALTRRLKDALALVDVRVLDHFVVGCTTTVSFSERGWL